MPLRPLYHCPDQVPILAGGILGEKYVNIATRRLKCAHLLYLWSTGQVSICDSQPKIERGGARTGVLRVHLTLCWVREGQLQQ